MKRILLVQPPGYAKFPPLGLLKLASLRRQKGDSIHLIMPELITTKKKVSIKKQISTIRHKIENIDFEPDISYVTSLFTWDWKHVHSTIDWIRRKTKNPIYLGGIYATLMPEHAKSSGAIVKTGILPSAEEAMPAYDLVPEWESSMGFSSRGCVNHCQFCAVPRLEPGFKTRKSIQHMLYPGHKGITLFDNNFLASPYWKEILEEITETKRWVDFNQGLDFRLLDQEKAKAIIQMRIYKRYIRTAMDSTKDIGPIIEATSLLMRSGLKREKDIMAYALYNFTDTPEDFLERLKVAMDLNITLYPMRYQPTNGEHALKKDSYVSSNWTKTLLDYVAYSRRVIGWSGAFIPRKWFKEQVKASETIEDALFCTKKGFNPHRPEMKGQKKLSDFES